MKRLILSILIISISINCISKTYEVGPSKTYKKPSDVSSLVQDGDIINIDAGTYTADATAWYSDNLLIRGVGGMAHLNSNGVCVQGKAIWVVAGNNTVIENIEFSGATVTDNNGAGIRLEGKDLTIRHCYFHDNENGILAGDNSESDIVIEFTEFANNGYGDGYTHNMYINHVKSFTLRFCYTHHAKIGHTVKSRAYSNYILYNRIMDEQSGTASMLLDLPNGGFSVVLGNIIMQGPNATNNAIISYGAEGLTNPQKAIYIVNNTVVNERHTGVFVYVKSGASSLIANNIFTGVGDSVKAGIYDSTNLYFSNASDAGLINPDNYDYHLKKSSTAIDAGINLGFISAYPLTANYEYKEKADSILREKINNIDIGAFEYFYDVGKLELYPKSISSMVFPNPFSKQANIKIDGLSINNYPLQLIVFNTVGQIVKTIKIEYPKREIILKVGNLEKGTYFYKLKSFESDFYGYGKFLIY
ncbi:MAG: T9SS type A sorting domain-containing protein [Bacteroidota bacterium]|nr:T9SS type A sorting domain-containing protein [Bacteroidota bacterium]